MTHPAMVVPALVCALVLAGPVCAAEEPSRLPGPVVPEGLGVNIHFDDSKPGEVKMLAEAGFGIIRMDLEWGNTERKKGVYDFASYERLLAELEPYKIRALFILDYSNKLYDQGFSPHTDEGREAFAKWAAAAAKAFKGRGMLWEMYNEPNIGFWKPVPNPDDYVKLALAVGKALRAAAPGEIYIGPATSEIAFGFLETCFKGGLLEYWDAVSVHPYRQSGPETAAQDYRKLRRLIHFYAPKNKEVPIISGEWGYSSAWEKYDEAKQGKNLPREWLVNLANDVSLSIWYDWHDDGKNAKDPECHFGTTLNPYYKNREPVYDPKPAYLAAKTLTSTLRGYRFNKRLDVGYQDVWVLLFAKDNDVRVAAWSAAAKPQPLKVPASPGKFRAVDHLGKEVGMLEAGADGLVVTLSDAPLYLIPEQPNELLQVAAAWERAALEYWLPATPEKAAISLRLKNPLGREIRITPNVQTQGGVLAPGGERTWDVQECLNRFHPALTVHFVCEIAGMGKLAQETLACVRAPLELVLLPLKGDGLSFRINNPSGEPFKGDLALTNVEGFQIAEPRRVVEVKDGERETIITFPCVLGDVATYRVGVQLIDSQAGTAIRLLPTTRVTLLAGFPRVDQPLGYRVVPDGDAKVASEQSLAVAEPPEPPPLANFSVLKLSYRFDSGWKFARVVPTDEKLKDLGGLEWQALVQFPVET